MKKMISLVCVAALGTCVFLFAPPLYSAEDLSSLDISRIEKSLARLKSEERGIKSAGYKELTEIGVSAAPYIIEAVKDKEVNTDSRRLMCDLLGELKAKQAVPVLIYSLNNKTDTIRAASCKAMGLIADPQALDPLLGMLSDEDGDVREAAVYALASFNGTVAMKVVKLIKDKEDFVRVAVLRVLNEKVDPATAGDIREALQKDKSGNVRALAARALGGLKDKGAVDAVIFAVIEDADNFVREECAGALGKIGDAKAVPALIAALKDEYKDVQLRASVSLKSITGESFGRDQEKWQSWYEGQKK